MNDKDFIMGKKLDEKVAQLEHELKAIAIDLNQMKKVARDEINEQQEEYNDFTTSYKIAYQAINVDIQRISTKYYRFSFNNIIPLDQYPNAPKFFTLIGIEDEEGGVDYRFYHKKIYPDIKSYENERLLYSASALHRFLKTLVQTWKVFAKHWIEQENSGKAHTPIN